jgi:hypothetical protein
MPSNYRTPPSSKLYPFRCAFDLPLLILAGISLILQFSWPVVVAAENEPADGVFPINSQLCDDMKQHHVLNDSPVVNCGRLRLVKFEYVDFDGQNQRGGEIVVLDVSAEHVLQIFRELRRRKFPIAKARPIHLYDGNDRASMADNNTSAFNDRNVAGSSKISLHAYGAAIDVNPLQNPFVTRSGEVSPPGGKAFVQRRGEKSDDSLRAGMAEGIIDVFADHGFVEWGGDWRGPIDYQHFQIPRGFAARLAGLPPTEAKALFESHLIRYITCRKEQEAGEKAARKLCEKSAYS